MHVATACIAVACRMTSADIGSLRRVGALVTRIPWTEWFALTFRVHEIATIVPNSCLMGHLD
jgi:hypothetical protein